VGVIKEKGRKSAFINKIFAIFEPYLSSQTEIQNLVGNFFGIYMRTDCMQNFIPLSLKLGEEIEDDGRTYCKKAKF